MKKVFGGLAGFNMEVTFRITKDCLFFSNMSIDNTSMVVVKLPQTIFQKYEFTEPMNIKVNASIIKKVLGNVGKEDNVHISFDETFSQIKITLSSSKFKKSYEVPLIAITDDDKFKTDEPVLVHELEVKCNNKEVMEMLDCLVFSGMSKGDNNSISIVGDEKSVSLKEDTQYGKTTLTLKDFDALGLKKKITVQVSYNLFKPLVAFQQSLLESSSYFLKKEYPIKVYGKSDEIESYFILAPRVENE